MPCVDLHHRTLPVAREFKNSTATSILSRNLINVMKSFVHSSFLALVSNEIFNHAVHQRKLSAVSWDQRADSKHR